MILFFLFVLSNFKYFTFHEILSFLRHNFFYHLIYEITRLISTFSVISFSVEFHFILKINLKNKRKNKALKMIKLTIFLISNSMDHIPPKRTFTLVNFTWKIRIVLVKLLEIWRSSTCMDRQTDRQNFPTTKTKIDRGVMEK